MNDDGMATKKPNLLDRNPTYKPGPIPFCPLDGHMLVYERARTSDTTKVNRYGLRGGAEREVPAREIKKNHQVLL